MGKAEPPAIEKCNLWYDNNMTDALRLEGSQQRLMDYWNGLANEIAEYERRLVQRRGGR